MLLHYRITPESAELERAWDDAIKEGQKAAQAYRACDQIHDLHERVQARMKAADAQHRAFLKERRAMLALEAYAHGRGNPNCNVANHG